jgi:hypothetical protein
MRKCGVAESCNVIVRPSLIKHPVLISTVGQPHIYVETNDGIHQSQIFQTNLVVEKQ